MPGRLRAEHGLAVVQFVAGAMLRNHARDAAATGRQLTPPADVAQAFDRRGIAHKCPIMPCPAGARAGRTQAALRC